MLDITQIPINNNLVIPSLESNVTLDINGTLIIRNSDNTLTINGVNYKLGSSFIIGNIQFTLSGIGSPVVLTTAIVSSPSFIISNNIFPMEIPPSIAQYWTPGVPMKTPPPSFDIQSNLVPNTLASILPAMSNNMSLPPNSGSVVNNITVNNIDNRQDNSQDNRQDNRQDNKIDNRQDNKTDNRQDNRQDNKIDNRQDNKVDNRQNVYPMYKSGYTASENQNNNLGNTYSKRLYRRSNLSNISTLNANQSSFNSDIMTLINTGVDLLSSRLSKIPPNVEDIDSSYDSNLLHRQYLALGNISGTKMVTNVNTLISIMYNFAQVLPNSTAISDVISTSYDLLSNNVTV